MELSEVRKLALELIKENGATCWFTFSEARRQLGCYSPKDNTIHISKSLAELNNKKVVKDVLLHEIAHSLTRGHGHDRVFKRLCSELGCSQKTFIELEINKEEKRYLYTCKNCGKVIQRHTKNYTTACLSCCKKYNKGEYSKKYLFNISENPLYEKRV